MGSSIFIANASIIFSAYSESDWFGKLIFLGLFTLSVICWVVLIHKARQTKQIKQVAFAFEKAFEKNKDRLLSINLEEMPKPTRQNALHPFGEIFSSVKSKTLEVLKKNHYFVSKNPDLKGEVYLSQDDLNLIESHVLTTISSQIKQVEKNLFLLSTIITLAPFLGLLGTVWGILITFSGLQSGSSMASNSMILGGLSTALSTTVLGLLIAIPALVSYNYFKSSLKHISSDMEDFLYQLLSTIELQYRKPL